MSQVAYIKPDPVNIPDELQVLPHWVNWDPALIDERWTKVLKNAHTRNQASSTNPDTWATFERAMKTNPGRIGFVLTSSGFTVIDLDHCRDPDTGIIAEWAWLIIRRLNSYTEISVSGTGVHIIVRGQLPPGRRRVGQIETYDSGRYITMTGAVVDGHGSIRDDDGILAAWHVDTFPQEPEPTSEPFTRMGASLATEEIIERATRAANGATFREYYEGGLGNKPSMSEARYALIGMTIFWTQDPEKIEDVLRSSGQWNAKVEKRPELVQKEIRDQLHRYHGPIYGEHRPPPKPTPPPVFEPGATCDQRLTIALETIRIKNKELAAARDTIARQAARLDAYSVTATAIKHIIASNQIEAGPKLAAVALVMEEGDQQKRGKPAAALGRHLPGSWIAKRAGVSVNTANRHIKRLADAGLVERKVVAERVIEDMVDDDTGEIIPAGRTISRAYYPDQASALIAKFTSYERPDDAPKHGGTRDLRCKHHPDSPTTTTHITTCDACQTVLDEHVTLRTPTGCEHQDGVSTIVTNPKGDTKMVFAPQPPAMPPPGDYSDAAHDCGRFS
jgi:DNA-binding transcriptional ArsR family regulator